MIIRVLAAIIFILIIPSYVYAAESDETMNVELIYPENQTIDIENYFDLDAEPGEDLELKVLVRNTEDQSITLNIEKKNAFTAPEGGIIYEEKNKPEKTASADEEILFSDIVEAADTVTLSPQESKELTFNIAVPEHAEGTLLGGISLVQKTEERKDADDDLGTNFFYSDENEFSFAVKLNLPGKPSAGFSLGKAGFDTTGNHIFIEMANDAARIEEKVEGTYTVTNRKGEELLSGVIDPFAMAPNSEMHYPIEWQETQLQEGTYVLMLKGYAGEKEFFTEETVQVSVGKLGAVADSVETADEGQNSGSSFLWVWIGGGILFLILVLFCGRKIKNSFYKRIESSM